MIVSGMLASIRGRLVGLILLAILPFLVMAVLLAWQNFQLASLESRERVAWQAATAAAPPVPVAVAPMPGAARAPPVAAATRAVLSPPGVVLMRQMILLGVLLLASVALVAWGADRLIAAPMRGLARAVAAWRRGGSFTPGENRGMPIELQQLSITFAQAATALSAREADLRAAVAQQEALMQEVHHRVKNNLQIVASLLNLQASRIRQEEARAEFQSARDRVRALATLHRHLYANGELHSINMRSFLAELCAQLFQAIGEIEGNRIALSIEAPELQMISDQAVPLALIVTEAVGNALKFAFPGGRRGSIEIVLHAAGERAELVVRDNGIGMPPMREEASGDGRRGIGLQMIRGFARQLGASLAVEQADGTCYRVALTLRRARLDESRIDFALRA